MNWYNNIVNYSPIKIEYKRMIFLVVDPLNALVTPLLVGLVKAFSEQVGRLFSVKMYIFLPEIKLAKSIEFMKKE